MDFETATQPLLCVLHFAGLSGCSSTKVQPKPDRVRDASRSIFRILFRLSPVVIIILQYYDVYYYTDGALIALSKRKTGEIYLLSDAVLNLFLSMHSITVSRKVLKIFDRVHEMSVDAANKRHRKIDFRNLKEKMFHHFLAIFSPIFFEMITVIFIPPKLHSFIFIIRLFSLQAISGLFLMQVIFFAELIGHLLRDVIEWLSLEAKSSGSCLPDEYFSRRHSKQLQSRSDHIAELLQLKMMHFNLWQLSMKTTKYLGWSYLLVMFRQWLQFGGTSCAAIVLTNFYGLHVIIIRKYRSRIIAV